MIIYPFKKGRKSTALLKQEGCRIRYKTSTPTSGIATSWGCSVSPPWAPLVHWINHPAGISWASNKYRWAELCREHGIGPTFTKSKERAAKWIEAGDKVLCRTLINSAGGKGIVVARNKDDLVDAKLYTKYFTKQREYRIVYGDLCGMAYTATKRIPRNTKMNPDDKLIRTKVRGFIYQDESPEDIPLAVQEAVREAARVLSLHGLNLLAYDVAYNKHDDTACVIEANTAWGLNSNSVGNTVEAMETIAKAKGWEL